MNNKRIREIDNRYHCSIIGTCLTLDEVRRLLEKSCNDDFSDYNDYILHGMAVNGAGEFSRFSNRLTEKLNAKYRKSLFITSKMTISVQLEKFWKDSFSEGDIAGPYWAVLSHPECTENLKNIAFGEVHMLSHLSGSSERTSRMELNKKNKEIVGLRTQLELCKTSIADTNRQLLRLKKENLHITAELKRYKEEAEPKNQVSDDRVKLNETLQAESEKNRKKYITYKERCEILQQKIFTLMEELNSSREFNEVISGFTLTEKKQKCTASDISSLPSDLDGKKVLLVGGRASIVPHCKTVVEIMNGRFIYHDGGREQSRAALQKLVQGADVVICALDCVSHDASRCVKRMCRDEQQVIMMKNSGLSTFTRELERAV